MKLVRPIVVLLLISTFSISCEQGNDVNPTIQLSEYTNSVINSSKFTSLGLSVASLNLAGSQLSKTKYTFLTIPFEGMDERKGLLAHFNEKNQVISVTIFEAISNLPIDQIELKMKNMEYTGGFSFETEDGRVQLNLENSKIVSSKVITKNKSNAKEGPKCNDITEPGGAYDCAGARFEQMNPVDKFFCVATGYVPCFAQLVVSCIWDKCVVTPPNAS